MLKKTAILFPNFKIASIMKVPDRGGVQGKNKQAGLDEGKNTLD